jgi:hypothetical protein
VIITFRAEGTGFDADAAKKCINSASGSGGIPYPAISGCTDAAEHGLLDSNGDLITPGTVDFEAP